jgi:hypothetical protein
MTALHVMIGRVLPHSPSRSCTILPCPPPLNSPPRRMIQLDDHYILQQGYYESTLSGKAHPYGIGLSSARVIEEESRGPDNCISVSFLAWMHMCEGRLGIYIDLRLLLLKDLKQKPSSLRYTTRKVPVPHLQYQIFVDRSNHIQLFHLSNPPKYFISSIHTNHQNGISTISPRCAIRHLANSRIRTRVRLLHLTLRTRNVQAHQEANGRRYKISSTKKKSGR